MLCTGNDHITSIKLIIPWPTVIEKSHVTKCEIMMPSPFQGLM